MENMYEIGKYYENKGVFSGQLDTNNIFVALHDLKEKDKDGEVTPLFDWNKANIAANSNGYHLPDLRELTLLWLNKNKVNQGLEDANGQKLEGWYWSSTEYNNYSAWVVDLSSGSRYNEGKDFYRYVRPVLALKL